MLLLIKELFSKVSFTHVRLEDRVGGMTGNNFCQIYTPTVLLDVYILQCVWGNALHYHCVKFILALLRMNETSSAILSYLSECREKLEPKCLFLCDECAYDVVRINNDSIESILDTLYILTQHLIKL